MDSISLSALAERIRSEAEAYAFLEELRWDGHPRCAHCGSDRVYFLNPANGSSRRTRTGSASERRVWKCGDCRKQFSVLTNTIFHGTKISLRKWLMVVFEMCASKNGVAAREVERKYDLTPKTAWFMLHRIREAMKREPLAGLLTGRIVADETFVGGKERNRHGRGARTVYERRSRQDKTAVLSLVSRETGEVRSRVLPNVHAATLRKVIREEVDMKASHLHSDSSFSYGAIGKLFVSHSSVDHSANEYVRGDVSTNQAENYFAQLKRSIDGTHHRVSRQHLPRYVAEFDFRFSTRKERDTARTRRFFRQVTGRRLTYRSPVSKTAF